MFLNHLRSNEFFKFRAYPNKETINVFKFKNNIASDDL